MDIRVPAPGKSATSKVLAVPAAFEAEPGRLTLSDISERSGVALSSAHRLVAELVAWGALDRGTDGRYQVGIRIWELGQHAARELTEVARPFLQAGCAPGPRPRPPGRSRCRARCPAPR
ncbi:helix-turn-helix domain-containing protein [Streptomyces sp. NPDC002143]